MSIKRPSASGAALFRKVWMRPLIGLSYVPPLVTWLLLTVFTWQGSLPFIAKLFFTLTLNIILSMVWPFVWGYWVLSFII
jgi:hypothetical protein